LGCAGSHARALPAYPERVTSEVTPGLASNPVLRAPLRFVRRVPLIAVTGVLVGLTVLVTWPQVMHLSSAVTDFGDPLLNSWTLAWVAHQVPIDPRHVFDAPIFHPEIGTLAYSESLLLPGLAVAPVLWLGGDPILAHNIVLFAGYVLSGLAMFWLVRALTRHDGAALVAAAIFAVYPYRLEEYAKVQLQLVCFLPLALWALHRVSERPSWRTTSLLACSMTAQIYSCLYYGIYGSMVIALVALIAVAASAAGRRLPLLGHCVMAAVATAILSLPLAQPYRLAARVVGERSLEDVERGSAVIHDYLRAHPDNALYGQPAHPGIGERRLFPGYVTPALALSALAPPIGWPVVAYASAAVVSADLSLGLNAPGYRWLYQWIWPIRGVRVPARFAMLVGLALAILAGFGVERVCRGRPASIQTVIVVLAVGSVTIESRPHSLDLSQLPDRAPAVYAWLATQPRGVVCEYPVGNLQGRAGPQDATYMYYATRHWQPLVNGYSGFAPPSYLELLDRLRSFPDDGSIAYLHARGVKYLLVHSTFYIRGNFDQDISLLKARDDLEPAGRFAWKGGGVTEAFRIRH
jgi:hypothetical protein